MVGSITQRLPHIVQRIICRPVIGIVHRIGTAVQTDAQRINSGIHNLFNSLCIARIGIHIDGAITGLAANFCDCFCNQFCLHAGVSLAALTEADNTVFRLLQMMHRQLHDLLHRRHKRQPALRRRATLAGLQRDTSQTTGIAHRRYRNAPLPTMIKNILCRKTSILQRTVSQLFEHSIFRELIL